MKGEISPPPSIDMKHGVKSAFESASLVYLHKADFARLRFIDALFYFCSISSKAFCFALICNIN